MSAPDLSIGDAVTLKAGGPAMTVVELAGGSVRCVWCDDHLKPHELTVDTRALISAPATEASE